MIDQRKIRTFTIEVITEGNWHTERYTQIMQAVRQLPGVTSAHIVETFGDDD